MGESALEKVMSMKQAIEKHVHDGDIVYLAGFIQGEPFAAVHEIIRQGKKDLTISTAAGTILVDQLIGSGCTNRVISSYVWNPVPTSAHAFRRAIEQDVPHPIELEEYSLFALSLAYFAGALDLPYIATKTLMGSDLARRSGFLGEKKLCIQESPFTGETVCLIPPLKHDVGIIQVQRSDTQGNAQLWGVEGPTKYGIQSCSRIIVCTEEIVEKEIVRRDPARTIVPGFKVNAVVAEPWGSHPSYVQGIYDRDWKHFPFYDESTKTIEGFNNYVKEWILDINDRKEYLGKIGDERLNSLKGASRTSTPVDYGHYDAF